MDWLWKSAVSALSVLLVLAAARRCGPRVAGFVAAMPWITAPALGWLAHEQGVAFAVRAAVSSVAACAMLSAFALLYAVGCRRGGIAVATLGGSVGAVAMTLPTVAASGDLGDALALALGCWAIASVAMRDAAGPAVPGPRRSCRSTLLLALAAGATSAFAASVGPALGAFAAGLLASVPVISGSVVVAEHAAGRRRSAAQFLHGYVAGLVGRAAFGAVFALLAGRIGVPAALSLGVVAAGLSSTFRPADWSIGLGAWAAEIMARVGQAQPFGPRRFGARPFVAGSLCGRTTRPRRRLVSGPDSPRRGP